MMGVPYASSVTAGAGAGEVVVVPHAASKKSSESTKDDKRRVEMTWERMRNLRDDYNARCHLAWKKGQPKTSRDGEIVIINVSVGRSFDAKEREPDNRGNVIDSLGASGRSPGFWLQALLDLPSHPLGQWLTLVHKREDELLTSYSSATASDLHRLPNFAYMV